MFGLLDDMLEDLTLKRKENAAASEPTKKEHVESINRDVIQDMPVCLSELPPEFDRVKYGNVVNVSAADLQDTSKSITRNTSALSEKLLQKLLPLLLSYSSATNYTQAVLKEGLKLDLAFDPGLEEVVKHVGYLAVAHHFVRNSGLPRSTKKHYLDSLSENLGVKTVERVFSVNAASAKVQDLNRLAAVVRRSQDAKAQDGAKPVDKDYSPIASSRRRSR